MTTSGHSPVSGFSPRRRSLLLAGLGGAATAALAPLGHTSAAAAGQPARSAAEPAAGIDFDFDTGNFIRDLISNQDQSAAEAIIAPMDVTLLVRFTYMLHTAWFDAVAPYHPTAVGVYSRLDRRPPGESRTNRNKNIAALYASYQVIRGVVPEREPGFRQLLTAIGLDPDDESEDRTSPIGIGNLAGKAVVAARERDGMNQLGDKGRRYNGKPYEDYTGYQPVNTAHELVNPSRWQPQLLEHGRRLRGADGDKGVFMVQVFVTPQMRLTKPHTFRDPSQFSIAPPKHADHTKEGRYKRSVDEILDASAALTDEQKVKAEFFDNKFLGVGRSVAAAARAHELDFNGWVQLFMATSVAMFDDLIAAWHQKIKYDVVRPFSAVQHVYGSTQVTAWGGPGEGTVNDIPANEWASYLNVGNHAEYPSASTTVCSAEAQAARRFLDSDVLDWTWTYPAGSSLVEPGLTPASDLEMHWATWTDFVQDCATSRVWGGVHFSTTSERSIDFGKQFGNRAYEYVQRHINGDVEGEE